MALDTSLSGSGTDHSGFVTFVLMVEFWTGRAKCVFFKVLSCQHQLYAPQCFMQDLSCVQFLLHCPSLFLPLSFNVGRISTVLPSLCPLILAEVFARATFSAARYASLCIGLT